MKKSFLGITIVLAVFSFFLFGNFLDAADDSQTWSIAGQTIKRTDGPPPKLAEPVSADAVARIPGATGQMIINIFPASASGAVDNTAVPKVIMVSGTDSFKLNQTMDNSTLKPGTYLMNAMANEKTNRVVFTVK